MSKLLTTEAAFEAAKLYKDQLHTRFHDIITHRGVSRGDMLTPRLLAVWVPLMFDRTFEDIDWIYLDRLKTVVWVADRKFVPREVVTMKAKINRLTLPQGSGPRVKREIASRIPEIEPRPEN